MKIRKYIIIPLILTVAMAVGQEQHLNLEKSAEKEVQLPLKAVSLYSSGVAFYEHEGELAPTDSAVFSFSVPQINDVLKSLVVSDSSAQRIRADFHASDALSSALASLNLSDNRLPTLKDIFHAQYGASIVVTTPSERLSGVIAGLSEGAEEGLLLATPSGIKKISVKDIQQFSFADATKTEALFRLFSILEADFGQNRQLTLHFDTTASKPRTVNIFYVMESPIWKPSYRLELIGSDAILQAWAVVNNASNTDWKDIRLSLLSGKPVSFKQNMYEPTYVDRQTVPIVKDTAQVIEYDAREEVTYAQPMEMLKESASARRMQTSNYADSKAEQAGESLFSFTVTNPVSLAAHKSMLIPFTTAIIPAKMYAVFSSEHFSQNRHPYSSIEIENTAGIKLPAGSITVFADSRYVGDALLNFTAEKQKKLLGFGEDVSVVGKKHTAGTSSTTAIAIQNGVLTEYITEKRITEYTIQNDDIRQKNILIEQPINTNFSLEKNPAFLEKTLYNYRFSMTLEPQSQKVLTVVENRPVHTRREIARLSDLALISYTTDGLIPEAIQKQFTQIIAQKKKMSEIDQSLVDTRVRITRLGDEQERLRKNITAIQNLDNSKAKDFLQQLLNTEQEIQKNRAIEKEEEKALFIESEKLQLLIDSITIDPSKLW